MNYSIQPMETQDLKMEKSSLQQQFCPLCHCSNKQIASLTMLGVGMYEFTETVYFADMFIFVSFCVKLAVKTNPPLGQYGLNLNLCP